MKTRKVPHRPRPPAPAPDSRVALPWIAIAIGAAVLMIYWQTFGYGFVSFDDGTYVYQNAMIRPGLTLAGLKWAFTTFYASNWHPLTWISLMIDASMFGIDAGEQHAVNVLLHLASSTLLFLVLVRMTAARWRSAMVAGIFAVHPLHVESVAWIAERKDVLCTFFEMLTLWFYLRYTNSAKPASYALLLAAFACSLLAKPMAVTLPFVLILIDLWPLAKRRPLWEKAPMFAMSAAASVVTLAAQRRTGAMMSLARLPVADRAANAAVSYLRYLEKSFWPANLAVLYPIHEPSARMVALAVVILAGITAAAIAGYRKRPYVLIGWLWFAGMLVPVIGLVQVGFQSMADRYTYLPLVGLSIAVVWTIAGMVETRRAWRQPAAIAALAVLVVMAAVAWRQAGYWHDSLALFEHAIEVTDGNYVIHNNLGIDLQAAGRLNEAAAQFRAAVDAAPDDKDALNSLGAILEYRGNKTEAIALHRRAVAADPNYASAHFNLGHELFETGQMPEARAELEKGLRLEPESARGHAYLGALLMRTGDPADARVHLEQSLRLAPANAAAQSDLCVVLETLGRDAEAIEACGAALRMRPNSAPAQLALSKARAALNGR